MLILCQFLCSASVPASILQVLYTFTYLFLQQQCLCLLGDLAWLLISQFLCSASVTASILQDFTSYTLLRTYGGGSFWSIQQTQIFQNWQY